MVKEKYCGSHYWIEFIPTAKGRPLRERLYCYSGHYYINGKMVHLFKPYKRKGQGLALSPLDMAKAIDVFRPFVLDCTLANPAPQNYSDLEGPQLY